MWGGKTVQDHQTLAQAGAVVKREKAQDLVRTREGEGRERRGKAKPLA